MIVSAGADLTYNDSIQSYKFRKTFLMNAMLPTVIIAAAASVLSALATLAIVLPLNSPSIESVTAVDTPAPEAASVEGQLQPLRERVTVLEEALEQEQQGRLMLQRELAQHQQWLTDLKSRDETTALASADEANEDDQSEESDQEELLASIHSGVGGGPEGNPWRRGEAERDTQQALVAAGVASERALELVRQQDAVALAELELRDQAAREGWLDDDDAGARIDAALAAQQIGQVDLEEELTSTQWDRFLFQSGRSNRVVIISVLSGSAADTAQITPGDRLLAYAGEPIFRTRDLQRATQAGERGESVLVSIERGSERFELVVPRGPLGVTLAPDRVDPDAA